MKSVMDYEVLLERAYALLPEKAKEPSRFEMPKARWSSTARQRSSLTSGRYAPTSGATPSM